MRWIRLEDLIAWFVPRAAVVVPFVGIVAGLQYFKFAQARAFYDQHKLLNEMREAKNNAGGQLDPARSVLLIDPARAVLLKSIPLGKTKSEVNDRLLSEGFICRRLDDPRIRHAEYCSLTPNPSYIVEWIIHLDYDEDEKLMNANVWIMKSSKRY